MLHGVYLAYTDADQISHHKGEKKEKLVINHFKMSYNLTITIAHTCFKIDFLNLYLVYYM